MKMRYFLAYSLVASLAFWVSLYGYHLGNEGRRREGQPEQENIVGGSLLIGLVWPLFLFMSWLMLALKLFGVLNAALRATAERAARGSVGVHAVKPHEPSSLGRCTQHLPPTARYCPQCGTPAARHVTVRSFSP